MTALLLALLLTADDRIDGVVKQLAEHGAFVTFGKNEVGFVHVSDIGWTRETDPSKLLKVGQKVKVKVDRSKPDRPALVIKREEDDPWRKVQKKYRVGGTYDAKVNEVMDFGVFFELEPWVDALVHKSELPPGKKPSDCAVGQTLRVKVQEIDAAKRQIVASLR